ncbi:ABC transporter ATP-binding protein [Actinobaculum sp. 352]|uniref:ABC transporter ATP-binding protein n=1 Tax=Actinobaculum sp. 352 TaxID=2490946 RepID=UPI000F7D8E83|nr:ABC transporter ATP-binding protein [Actinobaculum sp. 352]RTE49739.1 ABC transporter ATP-binding protein [Actinobaculum sp. 352]
MRLPTADSRTVSRRLGGLVAQHRGRFCLVIGLQLLVALASVVAPQVIGRAIDAVSSGTTPGYIQRLIALLLAVVVIQGILAYFGNYQSLVLGELIFAQLRNGVVNRVTHLPISVVESAGTGDLLGRTTHDIDRVQTFVHRGIPRFLILVLTILVTMGAAVLAEPQVGFLVVVPIIPMWLAIRWYTRRSIPAYLAASALWSGVSGTVSETVEQIGTVDSLRLGEMRVSRMSVLIRELWRNERYTGWIRSVFIVAVQLIVSLPILLVIAWGAYLMGRGVTTLGAVTAVALYTQQLRGPLWELGWWMDELQFSSASFARIFGVDMVPSESVSDDVEEPRGADLACRDVHFSYRDGEEVLHGVDLDVRPGETLAIVGPSGAGKSTLGRLIAGINAPDSGAVQVGGAQVTRIGEAQLCSTVALVTQEHHVFVGTVADNLRFAKPDATDDELRAALASVNATWLVELEDGLETVVGSGGKRLTPAQAQQIALARIVLLDPKVLILDEATSLLDTTAARSVEQSLANVLAGRTVISIAHRLYTAHDADRVAVMRDGYLVELGSHDELVVSGGEYARLWTAWQQD